MPPIHCSCPRDADWHEYSARNDDYSLEGSGDEDLY